MIKKEEESNLFKIATLDDAPLLFRDNENIISDLLHLYMSKLDTLGTKKSI